MRRLELLIEDSRRETENEDFSDTLGISDEEFVRYANDAQVQLQSQIYKKYQDVFTKEKDVLTSSATSKYDLPVDTFLENAIIKVRYKNSRSSTDYFTDLEKQGMRSLYEDHKGYPSFYVRDDSKIRLVPPPSTNGTLRLNYVRKLDSLDIRRGQISAVTTTSTALTALTVDPSSASFDAEQINKYNRICIVGRDGAQKMRNIEIDSIDTSTGVVTLTGGSYTFEEDEDQAAAVGDYITLGSDSANVSELPSICERYIIAYMNWKILKRDSSVDSAQQETELAAMGSDIIDSFAEVDADVTLIPYLDATFTDEDF